MLSDSILDTEGNNLQKLKMIAANNAVDFIENGMIVGLGTGSTAEFAIRELSKRLNENTLKDLDLVPTSTKTESFAVSLGLSLTPLEKVSELDINIDGADEVDPELNLIKGGGGALLREKIVAQSSKKNIVVVDESKLSDKLGMKFSLPVEVFRFAVNTSKAFIESLNVEVELRKNPDGTVFTTDQDNYILDCNFGPITDLQALSDQLNSRSGIVEHGLFLGTTSDLIIGTEQGIKHISK